MEKTVAAIKDVKPNGFIIIDGTPCRIEKVDHSKSGKHGSSKFRVDAIGLLDGRRRSLVKPSSENVDVPIITKKNAQVLAIMDKKVQLMDLTDFSVFEIDIPEELKGQLTQGSEIQYFEVYGIRTLKQIK